jgi:acid phosphatase family membrane protein YuiD
MLFSYIMKDYRVWEMLLNPPLVAAFAAMASSQIFKVLKPLAKGKLPDLRKIVDYGGWPSSHTAFIVACTLSIGIVEGFRSSLFAVAGTVASILIYDILKMRRVVAQDSREIDRLLALSTMTRVDRRPQFEGHSPAEVAGGLLWGCAWAIAVCALYR